MWAQFRDGGIYNFKNASATGQSMTITEYSYLIVATTNLEDEMQLWEADEVSTGVFTLRNLSNGKYLKSPNSSYNAYWTTVATVDDNCKFSCTAVGDGTYTMRATNSTNNYHYLYYGSGKIQCWTADVKASRWYITEKVTYGDADVPGALSNLFSDAACTQLKKSFANEAAIEADADYKKLPTELRNMVKKVYSGTWTENNYDGSKSAWESNYAKKYRVQLYEPYNEKMSAATALGINWHTNMNNPTGIFANNGDKLYVMVEGTIKEGATLYIESYTGHGKLVDNYKNGQQLQPGLNIISCTADGSNYCINYIVETFDTSDGKRGNKAKARRLSKYDDLKIHIEGGYINGYYNKMGDNLYTPDKNADWDYIAARATQTDVTILGEYIVLQFPLNDADTEGNKGLNHYLTGKNITEAVIDEWDKVMIWERLLLGVLDKETTAAEAKQSPYSVTQSKDVFEYTGDDTDGFQSGYGDYYNVHGLSFGVGGSAYMYGSGDHCGYHYNTMESIIQEILTSSGSHWGPGHEIGHQHQALLTVNGLTEVTNNLFSNVVLWYFGETTSRYNGSEGSLSNVLAQFNTEGADFFSNNIWGQTIMYYKLFLYYHVLGHNPKFYPRLFEMLRQDPMSTGYEQDGSKCLMHFYKKCCLAAGEDLTEFFRAHGFFEVMENRLVGDYSNSVYNLTQAQIDAAIKEVKNLGYEENIAVLFVTDATSDEITSHKGGTLTPFGTVCGEFGSYANFNNNSAQDYTYSISGTTVTMSGEGGVGFAIFNKNGELIGFSDKKEFELSLDAVEAILNGEATFVSVNGDASTTAATSTDDEAQRNKSLLGELIEQVQGIVAFEDATGKKVGYYKNSSLVTLKEALDTAQTVYNNGESANYLAVFNALKSAYNEFNAADYTTIPMTAGTFILKHYKNQSNLLGIANDSLVTTNTLDDAAKWVFEKAGSGKYYIKNLSTGKYIDALTKNENVTVASSTGTAIYDVVPKGNPGGFAIAYADKVSFNTSWKGVIGWDYDTDDNSWWYITVVETDALDTNAAQLKELLDKTQALYDQMAVTPIPQVVPLTESNYYCNALQRNGAYPSDNFTSYNVLCDSDPFTQLHTAYSGTNPNDYHYIRVDLGDEYKTDLFAFAYTNRTNNNRQNPTAITVEGCNEADGTYEHIANFTLADGLPTANGSSFESDLLGTQGKTYRYLRFKVTETVSNDEYGNYPYFSVSELSVLKGSFGITANSKYASATITDDYMKTVFDALREAKHAYRSATTAEEYTTAYNALKTHYDILSAECQTTNSATLQAKKDALQELIDDTSDLIKVCGEVTVQPGTTNEVALQTSEPTAASYVSTNADQNTGGGDSDGGGIAALVDGSIEGNNYFHTRWGGTAVNEPHYFQVDLGEDLEYAAFSFSYLPRSGSPAPTAMKVYGSNDGTNFTNVLTTITSGLPAHNSGNTYTSATIYTNKVYRYLRFTVTESVGPGNNKFNSQYFFGLYEFDLNYITSEIITIQLGANAGEVTTDMLLEAYKENLKAQSICDYGTTEAQLDKAIAQLQAQYNALETAQNSVNAYRQALEAKIAETSALISTCGRIENGEVVEMYNAAGDATKAMLLEAHNQIVAAQELINAGTAGRDDYETATADLEAKRTALSTATTGTKRSTLRTLTEQVTALITLCTNAPGDVSVDMLNVLNTENQEAITLLQTDDLDAIVAKTSTLQELKNTASTAQQQNNKDILRDKIAQMQALIDGCAVLNGETVEYIGDVTAALLNYSIQAKDAALLVVNATNTTTADFIAATETLLGHYNTLEAAKNSTAKAELRAVMAQMTELMNQCGTVTIERNRILTPDTLQVAEPNQGFYLSTNADQNEVGDSTDGDGIGALIDGTVDTYMHTQWGGEAINEVHHVQVSNIADLENFVFTYATRKADNPDYTSPAPSIIEVYGSTDGVNFSTTPIATFALTDETNPLLPYSQVGEYWTSADLTGAGYTAIRLCVTESKGPANTQHGGNYYFAMSEFALQQVRYEFNVTVELGLNAGVVTEAELIAAAEANALAEEFAKNTADAAELTAKKAELQTIYDALLTAKNTNWAPVTLTTDINNPVLYTFKSLRGDTKALQYDPADAHSFSITDAIDGAAKQAFFFMMGTEREQVYIYPYAGAGMVLGADNTDNGANKVFAGEKSAQTYEQWTFTERTVNDATWYDLKPVGKNTYFSNYGGGSNNMGFYSYKDEGSGFQFVETSVEGSAAYHSLKIYYEEVTKVQSSELPYGDGVGYYPKTQATAYNAAYAAAGALLNSSEKPVPGSILTAAELCSNSTSKEIAIKCVQESSYNDWVEGATGYNATFGESTIFNLEPVEGESGAYYLKALNQADGYFQNTGYSLGSKENAQVFVPVEAIYQGGTGNTAFAGGNADTSGASDLTKLVRFICGSSEGTTWLNPQFKAYNSGTGVWTVLNVYSVEYTNEYASEDDYLEAYRALRSANEALVMNMPEDGSYYIIQSVVKDNGTALVYANPTDNKMYWGGSKTATSPEALWKFEDNGNGTYTVSNMHTGTMMNGFIYFDPSPLNPTTGSVTLHSLASDGQMGIKTGNTMMHAQGGGDIVHWDTGANDGSAWRIIKADETAITYHVTISKYGLAGLYLNYPVAIPNDLTAYYINRADGVGGVAKLTPIEDGVIPANEGVILEGEANQAFTLNYSDAETSESSNLLEGVNYTGFVRGEGNTKYYLFGAKSGVVGLYWTYMQYNADGTITDGNANTDDGTHFKCTANKVYLPYDAGSGATKFSFRFDNTTDIEDLLNGLTDDAVIYDIQGRRIQKVTESGIYIVNGKKRYIDAK